MTTDFSSQLFSVLLVNICVKCLLEITFIWLKITQGNSTYMPYFFSPLHNFFWTLHGVLQLFNACLHVGNDSGHTFVNLSWSYLAFSWSQVACKLNLENLTRWLNALQRSEVVSLELVVLFIGPRSSLYLTALEFWAISCSINCCKNNNNASMLLRGCFPLRWLYQLNHVVPSLIRGFVLRYLILELSSNSYNSCVEDQFRDYPQIPTVHASWIIFSFMMKTFLG